MQRLIRPYLLADTAAEPGRFILRELVSKTHISTIHVLCYDHVSAQLKQGLEGLGKNVRFYDCLPPLSPDSGSYSQYFRVRHVLVECECSTLCSMSPGLEDVVDKFVTQVNKKYECHFIIIDSFSTLFLQKPVHVVYQILRQLTSGDTRST